jgi:hypothetical protein
MLFRTPSVVIVIYFQISTNVTVMIQSTTVMLMLFVRTQSVRSPVPASPGIVVVVRRARVSIQREIMTESYESGPTYTHAYAYRPMISLSHDFVVDHVKRFGGVLFGAFSYPRRRYESMC